MRRIRIGVASAFVFLAAALAMASPVNAATVGRADSTISINGATAYLDVFQSAQFARLIDRGGGTITALAGCTGASPDVICDR